MKTAGTRSLRKISKTSVIGVVSAMKNSEHMPPKTRARRRTARFAPSAVTARGRPGTSKSTVPLPVMKRTTAMLITANETGMRRMRA